MNNLLGVDIDLTNKISEIYNGCLNPFQNLGSKFFKVLLNFLLLNYKKKLSKVYQAERKSHKMFLLSESVI